MSTSCDLTIASLEKGARVFDWIPYVSTISGVVRFIAGKIQALVGLIMAAVGFIGSLCASDPHTAKKFRKMMHSGLEHAVHGCANMLRGAIAMVPFGGNAILLVWDLCGARFKYSAEYKRDHHHLPRVPQVVVF